MFEKYLQDVGLSEKEAQIYLALLQVATSSVLDLSKKTGIKRPTVYVTIESLAKKGLVSETVIGKKTHYQAEPPERLETFVERQKILLEEQSKKLRDVIPQIKSIQRESGERPVVKFFEGREGIISSSENIVLSEDGADKTMYMVYPKDGFSIFTSEELNRFKKVRINKGIKSKSIYTASTEYPSDSMSERLKIDENKYPISCDITIYGDKVRISTLGKELSGIFIKSKDFAETMRSLIDLIFDSVKDTKK